MDVVKSFNTELSSLYDVKPPISKAKMTSITKGAIKGIKFYKHIVQSVEKFIQKCRPEYKVPGLYVVDSIVRQSRHQFGADKDVFGPRFLKNINLTFQQLFKCAEDDRPKIIRVLNLWQKNAVFPIDVIQPLMDMGNPNTSNEWPLETPAESVKESPVKSAPANEESRSSRRKEIDPALWKGWQQGNDETAPDNRPYAEMSTKNLEKFTKAEMTNAIENEVSSSSMFRTKMKQENLPEENAVKFNKKLLDFDYGDEEDEEEVKNEDGQLSNQPNALALSMAQNLLSNPELLRQLQQMQQTIQQSEQAFSSELGYGQQPMKQEEGLYTQEARGSPLPQQPPLPPAYQQPSLPPITADADKDDRVLPQPPLPPKDLDERSLASIMTPHIPLPQASLPANLPPNQADKDDRVLPEPVVPARDLDERSLAAILAPLNRGGLPPLPYTEASMMPYQPGMPYPQQPPLPMMDPMAMDASYPPALPQDKHMMQGDEDERLMYSMPGEPPLPPQDFDERSLQMPLEDGRPRKERSRSRSGSRSRGRSGRHRSHSRSPRRKRSRSRSPSRKNNSSVRSKERERVREKEREREKERDRKRKGLPAIKKNCVSVCTTTLWIGHVPKSCTEMEISNAFGTYGTILSIYMIPPRGCAYVVMDRRQDAYKALTKLKNTKILQSSSVKMAWAPGKGVKGKEYKDYWEVEAGVSYIPFEKIPEDPSVLDLLEEGGCIDEESLPDNLRALRQQPDEKPPFNANNKMADQPTVFNSMQGPPMVPPPIIPPTSVNLPMLLHHPMQPQFGLHIPGLLPPQAMMMQVPMGIPPPNPMLMVQQQSQNLLGSQNLSLVGGVSPLVPRSVPPIASALQNLKNAHIADPAVGSPMMPAAGDATPTDEDGTSVSSPKSTQKPGGPTTTASIPSTQQSGIATNQFNHMMNIHNANRPMLPVPPPVSSAGTPIPYPPPGVGYNFPPPGMRPPNAQFPWMQQKSGSNFPEAMDSSQRMHMFNRPPLPSNPSPMKDATDRREMDRSSSPIHPDKMPQEMVISTDDESSMDREYEVAAGGRFPGSTEFPRMPMGMHRMRGPMPGPRFPQNVPMGSPFHARMGVPRPMGGPGMHRMEEFTGPRGPRMPVGVPPPPPGPDRSEGVRPQPNEGRDWYPRDFEAPQFERDRQQFRDNERGRGDAWTPAEKTEGDSRPGQDNERREERTRDFEKRDARDRPGQSPYPPRDRPPRSAADDDDDFIVKQRPRPVRKVKSEKELSNELLKLRFYQRDKKPQVKTQLQQQLTKRKAEDTEPEQTVRKKDSGPSQALQGNKAVIEKKTPSETQDAINARKEREARKRSRWGRTLSEEREYQEQRKCEIELKRTEIERKFQSYEQSSLIPNPVESPVENSVPVPENEKSISEDSTKVEIQNPLNEPGDLLESNNPVAQQDGASLLSDLPVAMDSVPGGSDVKETESVKEPIVSEISTDFLPVKPVSEVTDTNSLFQPSLQNFDAVPVAQPTVSKSEVVDFMTEPPVTNSLLHSSNNNHIAGEATQMSCRSNLEEPVPNPILTTTDNDLQEASSKDSDLSNVNVTETCSANESILSTES